MADDKDKNTKRMSGLPWPTANPRAQAEWDYSADALSEQEVQTCHEYEFGRMIMLPLWSGIVNRFRQGCPQQSYNAYKTAYAKLVTNDDATRQTMGVRDRFYSLWPEWPERPYLSVPINERRARLRDWLRFNGPETLIPVSFKEILAPYLAEIARLKAKINGQELPPVNYDFKPIGDTLIDLYHEIVPFRIDVYCTETEFMDMARNWYKKHCENRGVEMVQRRGAAAETKIKRADLRALGFWRLERSGMLPTQIVYYTQNIAGEPIVSDHKSDWSRTRARIKTIANQTLFNAFQS